MPNIFHIIEIAVGLGLLILVHELGHFLAAKWFGVHVRQFAIGFGPPLVKWRRGETEYSLRVLPLGGFVDLAGEHPEAEGADDPRGLWHRPVWQRAVVFAAGVAVNAAMAVVIFAVAFLLGVKAGAPIAGALVPGLPAAKAGIEPGDRLVAIGRAGEEMKPLASFDDLMYTVSLSNAGTEFVLTVERPGAEGGPKGAGVAETKTVELASVRPEKALWPVLGIGMPYEPVLYKVLKDSSAAQAGLEAGDRILAVNGRPVGQLYDAVAALEQSPPGKVTLRIERGGEPRDLVVDPAQLKDYQFGFAPPMAVAKVLPDSPAAEAGLEEGDRIAEANGTAWPTPEEFVNLVKEAGAGGRLDLVLMRGGKRIETSCSVALRTEGGEERPMVGVGMAAAPGNPVQIGRVEPGGAAERAGLCAGDVVLAVGKNGKAPGDWEAMLEMFLEEPTKATPIRVARGNQTIEMTLAPDAVPAERFVLSGFSTLPLYVPLPRIYNPLAAAGEGFRQTWMWMRRTYATASQLVRGQVSTEAVGGPVLIFQASYALAEQGVGTLINFFGMISVMLAVVNFLPLPPLDGGHVLFTLIEKLRGRALSLKVQSAFWAAGWALVGVVFLLILWQDIARILRAL